VVFAMVEPPTRSGRRDYRGALGLLRTARHFGIDPGDSTLTYAAVIIIQISQQLEISCGALTTQQQGHARKTRASQPRLPTLPAGGLLLSSSFL
jgi:hypothetical protein